MAGIYGRSAASIAGTLTTAAGPIVTTRTGFLEDALTSYGDLYPTFKLKSHVARGWHTQKKPPAVSCRGFF